MTESLEKAIGSGNDPSVPDLSLIKMLDAKITRMRASCQSPMIHKQIEADQREDDSKFKEAVSKKVSKRLAYSKARRILGTVNTPLDISREKALGMNKNRSFESSKTMRNIELKSKPMDSEPKFPDFDIFEDQHRFIKSLQQMEEEIFGDSPSSFWNTKEWKKQVEARNAIEVSYDIDF